MADTLVGAIAAKYAALAFTPHPDLFAFAVPQKADGDQVTPPYVVLEVESVQVERLWAGAVMETSQVAFTVYGTSLGYVNDVAAGILYGTGTHGGGLGFDDGELVLSAPFFLNQMRQTGVQPGLSPDRGPNNELIYTAAVRLEIELRREG